MIGWIQALLSNEKEKQAVPPEDRVRVATCVLLMEAAQVDEYLAPVELEHITAALKSRFALSEQEVAELIQVAAEARADQSGLWHFTHEINEICTVPDKIAVMQEVWRVLFADGVLSGHEDHLAHKIAHLLNLNHPQFIQAKRRARH